MTRLGIICRADEGGLGTQTWEYARHLNPDAVLLVLMDEPRGQQLPERYQAVIDGGGRYFSITFPRARSTDELEWDNFLSSVDVVLTAETFYREDFPRRAKRAKVRLVMHANPELWDGGHKPTFDVWAPTDWMVRKLPNGTTVMPMPVDRQRCAYRPINFPPRKLLHVSAPAMLDRNGTTLLKQALVHCRMGFDLYVAGPEAPDKPAKVGKITVHGVPDLRDYWQIYDDMDALVLPRRYGGLSLPMQEAASCGLPIVSLRLPPQKPWLHPLLSVPVEGVARARMKGGIFDVAHCAPRLLARALDDLVRGRMIDAMVTRSLRWAETLDWAVLGPIYREALL